MSLQGDLQAWCRTTGYSANFAGDVIRMLDAFGIPAGGLDGRVLAYARNFDPTIGNASAAWQYMFQYADALAIIAKYGASMYLPSTLNGTTETNAAQVANDGTVGYVNSGVADANAHPATQSTAGFRPQLVGGARNLLTYSEDFSNAAWIAGGSATKPTASTVVFTASIADKVTHANPANTSSVGMVWTYSVELSGSGTCGLFVYDDGGAFPGNSGGLITLTATPTRYSTTRTHTDATATKMAVQITNPNANAVTITATRAQLEVGPVFTTYVPTTTAAASSGSRPKAWLFDGTDDRLSLSGPLFQMSDDHFVVACSRLTDASTGHRFVFAQNGAGNVGVATVMYEVTTGKPRVRWLDDAATDGTLTHSTGIVGSAVVISGAKAGNNKRLRINGTQSAIGVTAMGAATITNQTLGYGGFAPAFAGNIYAVIAGKGTITDAELLCLERWAGSLGGISL